MNRWLPAVASILGGVGLGLACGYLVLIAYAFSPEGQGAVNFLVGASDEKLSFGFAVVLIPYALLMTHLWMRIRVGGWLADAGEYERARKYANGRTNPGIFRAAKEALANRTVLIRVAAADQDYDAAAELIDSSESLARKHNTFTVAFRHWALEVQLRRENLIAAHHQCDALGVPRERSTEAAGFCAAAAELATREGDETAAREWLERAEYAAPETARAAFSRGLLGARFATPSSSSSSSSDIQTAIDALDRAQAWLRQMPGARGEWAAAKAQLLAKRGDVNAATGLNDAAELGDARSKFVVGQQLGLSRSSNAATEEQE